MNCPHCNANLPEGENLSQCPECKGVLRRSDTPESAKTNWGLFFVVFLAPTVLAFLTPSIISNKTILESADLTAALIAAFFCSFELAKRKSSFESRFFWFLLNLLVICFMELFLTGLGCVLGGYQVGH